MYRSMVDIQSATAEIRRGKEEEIKKYNGLPYSIGLPKETGRKYNAT